MSLGFSYILVGITASKFGRTTEIKTQGSHANVITVYNHYVNIAVLPHIPYIPMSNIYNPS